MSAIRNAAKKIPFLQKLYGTLRAWKKKLAAWKTMNLPLGKKYYVVGTPAHKNLGDSAIALAEILFLKRTLGRDVKEFTVPEYRKYHRCRDRKGRFFWHGGGNMGDQWQAEESFRQKYIVEQLDRGPVIFPQTIHFSETESGREKLEAAIGVYNDPRMTIAAREEPSYLIMKRVFPEARVLLAPDIVLSTTMEDYSVRPAERSGALLVARSDPEKSVPDTTWDALEAAVKRAGRGFGRTDMYSDCTVTKENRAECVRKKMQQFCEAELVITDRLHGMVFAALTGTPCIVFSNYNHKVRGTYDWISYLPYIRYVETEEEAEAAIPALLDMKACRFDNAPLAPYFDELAKVVKERCRGGGHGRLDDQN